MSEPPAVTSVPKLVGAIPGNAFDRLTWSGSSHHLFSALSATGALVGTVDTSPPRPLDFLAKVLSFSKDRQVWRQRYMLSQTRRLGMSLTGAGRAARLNRSPDALLQVGAWYRFGRHPRLRPGLRCSYHDGNLAVHLRRSDLVLDKEAAYLRRALSFEQRVYDEMDLILPMSEWLRESFIEDFHQDPAKVVAVGAGANLHRVPDSPPKRDFGKVRLLFVGREFVRKGGPSVLEAFGRLRSRFPDAELWIVGPEPDSRVQPGVRWLGRILKNTREGDAEIDRLYREATAFVMPSLYEPFGVAFLEAMSYALPCVGADCCAMPEIIQDEVTGYVTPPGDVAALGERLIGLASDPDKARRMGEAGRARFVEHYTWNGVAAKIISAIEARL